MDRYVAVAVCRIAAGKVVLSAEQARSRLHNLAALDAGERGDGVYEIVNPIEFKRGETFGHCEPIPKAMAHLLADPDSAAGQAVIDEVAERTGTEAERKPRRERKPRKPRDDVLGVPDADVSPGADDDVDAGAPDDEWSP